MNKPVKFSFGVRLSLVQAVLIIVVMGIFTQSLTMYISSRLEKRTEHELSQQVNLLVNLISSYHALLAARAHRVSTRFLNVFPGTFALNLSKTVTIGDIQTPTITSGSTTLNLNTEIVDSFTAVTKEVATVFVRSGEDFIRVSTSLKKEDGSRAVGTTLERTHPAYRGLLNGEEFVGKATLFGKDYITKYLPLKDQEEKVIGVLFIGLDFTDNFKVLKEKIRSVKIGQTGYIYALEAKEGKDAGKLLIHPATEGSNILDARDAINGREFIKEMLKQKEGIIRYHRINKELGETEPSEKVVAYRHLKEWDWVICAGASLDELSAETRVLRNALMGATLLVVVLLVLTFMFIVRLWISRPLSVFTMQIRDLANPDSDRRQRLDDNRIDELGLLAESFNALLDEVHRDIAEKKLMEDELRASQQRYRTVADFTYDWEYWLSPDLRFIYCSPACERITGYRSEEFEKDPDLLKAITHPDDCDQLVKHCEGVIRPNPESHEQEFRIISRSGEVRWIGHSCCIVYGSDGMYLGRRASNRDITERMQTYDKLRQQRDLLVLQKEELEAALTQVKQLEGIIPICSYCKKIRDDKQSWHQLEQYITNHSEALFSHGICPDCYSEQMKIIEKME